MRKHNGMRPQDLPILLKIEAHRQGTARNNGGEVRYMCVFLYSRKTLPVNWESVRLK